MAIEKKYLGQAGVQALAKEIKQDLDVLGAENETKVPKTRKINNKPLSDDVELTADDVGADEAGAANEALLNANDYTDGRIANMVGNQPVVTQIQNATANFITQPAMEQYVNETILGGEW